jgi:hypothetical protein
MAENGTQVLIGRAAVEADANKGRKPDSWMAFGKRTGLLDLPAGGPPTHFVRSLLYGGRIEPNPAILELICSQSPDATREAVIEEIGRRYESCSKLLAYCFDNGIYNLEQLKELCDMVALGVPETFVVKCLSCETPGQKIDTLALFDITEANRDITIEFVCARLDEGISTVPGIFDRFYNGKRNEHADLPADDAALQADAPALAPNPERDLNSKIAGVRFSQAATVALAEYAIEPWQVAYVLCKGFGAHPLRQKDNLRVELVRAWAPRVAKAGKAADAALKFSEEHGLVGWKGDRLCISSRAQTPIGMEILTTVKALTD